jgi:protein-S-isoprenylcysteine O-methyltransferase Ste14
MSKEIWFKLAFIIAIVYVAMVATKTARLATARHGGSVNQLSNEVKGLIAIRAALGIVFYAMLIWWMVRPNAPDWSILPIDPTVRWIAVLLLVPLLAFFAWSFRSIGASYRGGVGLHDEHELVTTGAYARVRHPIYLAFICVMVLVLFISANWVIGLSGLLLVISIPAARVPIEERELSERFGEEWSTYRKRTGAFLPRPR